MATSGGTISGEGPPIEQRAVLLLGPPGTGKSHLTEAIGRAAIPRVHRVIYPEAHVLIGEIADAGLDGTRRHYLADIAAVPLLLVDDLGMGKLPQTAAEHPWSWSCVGTSAPQRS